MAAILRLVTASALVGPALVAQDAQGWSVPVEGVQGRFTFDRGDVFNGTRLTRVFLELHNISDVGSPIYLFYEPLKSVKARVYNAAGEVVPIGPYAASIMAPFPFLICLPYNSTLRLDVTALGYGVPKDKKALIGLPSGVWEIEKAVSAEYFVGGTFVAGRPEKHVKERIWSGALEIPKAKVDTLEL